MKPASRAFLSTIRSRAYSAQAAGKVDTRASQPLSDPKVTRLASGVIVASVENYSPVSRVSILYNAGPRYEPVGQRGLTHCLRAASNLSSQKASAFGIARSLQQIGASLSCSTTREHMNYTMQCKRDDLSTAAQFLADVAIAPAFKPWELETLSRPLRLDLDLLHRSPNAQLIEAVYKTAFRDTLGSSLYMRPDCIGSFSAENLEAFVKARYVSGNMAVAGIGVDHDALVQLVEKMGVTSGSPPAAGNKAKYHGGELRIDTKSDLVHAAIVSEGASMTSDDVLALYLLVSALDSTPLVQYSDGAVSKINQAISAATKGSFAANCFGTSYSDSGLFGIQVVANPQEIGKALKAVTGLMGQLTKSGITEEDLQRAKRKLKTGGYLAIEDSTEMLDALGKEALLTGAVTSAVDGFKLFDEVTLDSVNKVAKRIMSSRPTFAAVGDLVNTPYLDELM